MATLIWNDPSERIYDVGLDRGVLYFKGGEAWNGLMTVSVIETGNIQPYYLDGYNYASLISSEDNELSITAFTFPDKLPIFEELGRVKNSETFGMSYRTLVRDGIGSESYKIHIHYNVMASPAQFDYETISDDTSPLNFTWSARSRPIAIPMQKPTSYFIIDARYTPAHVLSKLEETLYGTETQDARLPWPSEIMHIFAGFGFGYGHSNYGHGLYGHGLTI